MMLLPRSKRRTIPRMSSPFLCLYSLEDDVALGVANALEEHLLGGLGRDAAEGLAGLGDAEQVAKALVLLLGLLLVLLTPEDLEADLLADLRLELVLEVAGDEVLHRDLAFLVIHLLDDGHELIQLDVTLVGVVAGFEVAAGAERVLGGLEDRRFDRFDEGALLDALLFGDFLENLVEVDLGGFGFGSGSGHGTTCSLGGSLPPGAPPLVALGRSLSFAGIGALLGLLGQLEDELCDVDVAETDLVKVAVHGHFETFVVRADDGATQHPLSVLRGLEELDLGEPTHLTTEVTRRPQGSVEPGELTSRL